MAVSVVDHTATEQAVLISKQPLTAIQSTAIDLYQRGFNVFPLPSAWEWRARSDFAKDQNKKPPYILKPLYFSRLHYCGVKCHHLPESVQFPALFTHANIGVMTGRTSGNLIDIDCDSQKAFDAINRELTQRGLPFWAIGSYRGGGFLLRLVEGEAANMPRTCFPDVQIWGNGRYQVLPPSIHPQGTIYRWETPEPRYYLSEDQSLPLVNIAAMDWLGVQLANFAHQKGQVPELHGLPKWGEVLSRRNRETLANGVIEGQRNSRLTAAAYDLAGNEIPYHEAEPILLAAADKCTPPYSNRDAHAIIDCAYRQKRQPARKSRLDIRAWKKAQDFSTTFNWRGKFGRKSIKRHAIFLACVERARQSNSDIWRASKRELSELSNTSDMTTWTALKQLEHEGLIECVGHCDKSGANLYRFGEIVRIYTIITPCSISGLNLDNPETQAEQDVFGRLGSTSWHVWCYLLTTPARGASQISKLLKLPRSSVYASLIRLQSAGLVVFGTAEQLYYGESKTDADLENLAITCGVHGKSDARKQVHRSEREVRVNWQIMRARQKGIR